MDRHHEAALLQALDTLYLEGATAIRWDHFYLWFNAQRLSKSAFREVQMRWEELCSRQGYEPPVLHLLNGKQTCTIIRAPFDGEDFQPLMDLTKRT